MPPRPYFFLSYARDDLKGELTFFDDLVEAIRDLTGIPTDEIGFRDTQAIAVGASWPTKLGEAVRQCGAFVYLHSPTYWKREWCGKEWYVFQSRLQGLVPRPELLLPVLWVNRGTPAAVAGNIQFTHADNGPNYTKYGLKHLRQIGQFQDEYREFLRNFAERVIGAVEKWPLPPDQRALNFDQVPNAFLPPPSPPSAPGVPATVVGPRWAEFVYVVGRRHELMTLRNQLDAYGDEELDWKPYCPPGGDPVAMLAQQVATAEKLNYRMLPLDANLVARLREAEEAGKIVVILVDCWTLHLDQIQKIMEIFDQTRFRNCVVLVPWNPLDSEMADRKDQLNALLQRTFSRQTGSVFRANIHSADKLKEELTAALNESRKNIIQHQKVVPRPATGEGFLAKPNIHAARGT